MHQIRFRTDSTRTTLSKISESPDFIIGGMGSLLPPQKKITTVVGLHLSGELGENDYKHEMAESLVKSRNTTNYTLLLHKLPVLRNVVEKKLTETKAFT